jgi:translation initiation factor 3 subunit B
LALPTALWKNITPFDHNSSSLTASTNNTNSTGHLAVMAPTFDTLSDHDFDDIDEEEIDFSGAAWWHFLQEVFVYADINMADLRAQYDVRKDQGLDTFVVIDGLPIVPAETKTKLVKFLLKKLNQVGNTSEDAVFMPMNDQNMSDG